MNALPVAAIPFRLLTSVLLLHILPALILLFAAIVMLRRRVTASRTVLLAGAIGILVGAFGPLVIHEVAGTGQAHTLSRVLGVMGLVYRCGWFAFALGFLGIALRADEDR
jgi:hypothetical protein